VGFLRDGYPVNVLSQLKQVPELRTIFCASANTVEVVLVQGQADWSVVGVIDGAGRAGVETEADETDRKKLLRAIG
jgi:adenosine/AMP kinase